MLHYLSGPLNTQELNDLEKRPSLKSNLKFSKTFLAWRKVQFKTFPQQTFMNFNLQF